MHEIASLDDIVIEDMVEANGAGNCFGTLGSATCPACFGTLGSFT